MAESWKDFVAGWVGGGTGIAFGHPLDTIRIRLQTQDSPTTTKQKVRYKGITDCFFRIIREEGVKGLYKGLLPPLLTVSVQNSILFMSYGGAKRYFQNDSQTPISLSHVYIAGAVSGLSCSVITTPSELIKCKLQVQKSLRTDKFKTQNFDQAQFHKGPLNCMKHIFKQNGFFGFFQGFWITVLRDAPSYGVYFWTYEFFQRTLSSSTIVNHLNENNSFLNSHQANIRILISGGFAGLISWTIIYPLDVLKSRLQIQSPNSQQYNGIIHCFQKSLRTEGKSFLFKGLAATAIRAFPVNSVTFFAYESFFSLLTSLETFDFQDVLKQ